MASGYQTVEADDSLEEGARRLEFKTFLSEEPSDSRPAGAANRGYLNDQPPSRSGFWTIEYYQKYFDVDTKTVLQRCAATLIPTTSSNFIATHLSPTPDLYGPFWILTTLIFALFVSSSLAASISAYLSSPTSGEASRHVYDFALLSAAASLVYAYGLGVPAALWAGLRYLGVDANEWSLAEALAVWGYGQFVWIPTTFLCIIGVPLVRWILVGIAFGMSGYFLLTNIYPIIATAESKSVRLLVIVIAVLQVLLALTFKGLFFSYYAVAADGQEDPLGGGGPDTTSSP